MATPSFQYGPQVSRSPPLPLKLKVKSLSRVRLFAVPWTVAHQALLSMGFSRQEYWSGLPFPSPLHLILWLLLQLGITCHIEIVEPFKGENRKIWVTLDIPLINLKVFSIESGLDFLWIIKINFINHCTYKIKNIIIFCFYLFATESLHMSTND